MSQRISSLTVEKATLPVTLVGFTIICGILRDLHMSTYIDTIHTQKIHRMAFWKATQFEVPKIE
jgi:hypothetical protein